MPGSIIGVDPTFSFGEAEGILEDGDRVFLYTDGVIELKNHEGELFGFERFRALIEKLKDDSIDNVVKEICHSLKKFNENYQDDVSLLICEKESPA